MGHLHSATGRHTKTWRLTLAASLVALSAGVSSPMALAAPTLDHQGTAARLMMDGKPLLVLGGELGNSSASSRPYMAKYWPKLKAVDAKGTVLMAQGLGRMAGFKPRVLEDGTVLDAPVTHTLGDYRFTVGFIDSWTPKAEQDTASHGGLIIQTGPEEYLIAGRGLIVTVAGEPGPKGDGPVLAGIDKAVEGTFDAQGRWVPGRYLNGDQTHQGRHIRLPPDQFQIQRVTFYRYR
ncbi:hypothetical protein FBZ89_11439 [Nitrospirillum amazonense]|uniref:DUF5597 domain-containing protein n=1 Tax=Nitrospirillum amazonense TaxID=28077 RepID=A0A560F1F4_9PROT|nr:DUF5597 domain-containing protein [Nitrospirillum amazonense]TWB15446.1 hypothetical protein FBZ89_11439 [Nitrospirillum amazonense]